MFTIRLAEHDFAVDNQYSYVERLCRDYMVSPSPEAVPIALSEQDRAYENQDGGNWKQDYLESLAVYRKICENLIQDDIILFHCSALAMDGQAVLFTGPSGTGKSTHARLWRQRFGDRLVTVNDDKPLLSFEKSEIRVWGTPYGGKDNLQTNTSAPVRAIVVLKQAPRNGIRRLSPHEAFPLLLNQTYRPRQPEGTIQALNLAHDLPGRLPVYELQCTISQEAVTLCHDTVFGKESSL